MVWIGPVPKPGYHDKEFMDTRPNSHNADMVKVVDGVPVYRKNYYPDHMKHVDGEFLEVRQYVGTPGRGQMYTRDVTGEWHIYSGSSPHRQIIWAKLKEYANADKLVTREEVAGDVSNLMDEHKQVILNTLKSMHRAGQIAYDENNFVHTGPDELAPKKERKVLPFRDGRHPTKMEIYNFISRYGTRSFRDILDHMMPGIGWIKRPDTLRAYLKEMENEGILARSGDTYEAVRMPERRMEPIETEQE